MNPPEEKECAFCRIAKKEVSATILGENEKAIAFLDIHPVSEGHVLVIPKHHARDIYEISQQDMMAVTELVHELADTYLQDKGIRAVNILHASGEDAQQSMFHFHMHLVPRRNNDGLDLWLQKKEQ